jgi:hypothetical protein
VVSRQRKYLVRFRDHLWGRATVNSAYIAATYRVPATWLSIMSVGLASTRMVQRHAAVSL